MSSGKFFIIVLIFVLMPISVTIAQSQFQAGIDFSLGFPQEEFKQNVDNIGFGLSGHFGYQIPHSPILVGTSIGFLIYGRETRREPLSTTIPDIVVDVETTNNILTGHLLLRVQPPMQSGIFQPYLEGLFGFHYLWTETKIQDWDDDDEIGSKNYDDAAMSYGGGGGVMIRVYQGKKENSDGTYSVNIDLGARYLFGGEAGYLKEGDIKRENGVVTFTPSKSTTDLVMANIGVTFNF
ncbi:MAG TPA: hypothetical protein VGD14_13645 [bacterium]